jgi:ribulose-phosphate 3-epimerase
LTWWLPRPTSGGVRPSEVSDLPAVAPSLLAARMERLELEIRAVERAGADFLHLDVMDGHFVPNLTIGPAVVAGIDRSTDLLLDTHLMIEEPGRYLEDFRKAGSDVLTVHVEIEEDAGELGRRIHGLGARFGLALNPDTPLERAEPYLDEVDLLLIMTVFPGFGGQAFMPEVLPKVERARSLREERGHGYVIEVDGGIQPETAPPAVAAGARILVAGTAVFGEESYEAAIRALRDRGGAA